MKEKNIRKSLLPLCLMALCFMMINVPVVSVNTTEDIPQIAPFSDMEDDDTIDGPQK